MESIRCSSEGGKLMSKLSLSVAGGKSCVDEAVVPAGLFGVFVLSGVFFLYIISL